MKKATLLFVSLLFAAPSMAAFEALVECKGTHQNGVDFVLTAERNTVHGRPGKITVEQVGF